MFWIEDRSNEDPLGKSYFVYNLLIYFSCEKVQCYSVIIICQVISVISFMMALPYFNTLRSEQIADIFWYIFLFENTVDVFCFIFPWRLFPRV